MYLLVLYIKDDKKLPVHEYKYESPAFLMPSLSSREKEHYSYATALIFQLLQPGHFESLDLFKYRDHLKASQNVKSRSCRSLPFEFSS